MPFILMIFTTIFSIIPAVIGQVSDLTGKTRNAIDFIIDLLQGLANNFTSFFTFLIYVITGYVVLVSILIYRKYVLRKRLLIIKEILLELENEALRKNN